MKTLKLSQHPEDHSTIVPLDFPAKISVLEDSKKESEKELGQDYFTSAFGYLGKFDLSSPSLKTCEIYSPLKKGGYSKKSSFKLPKQGMMLNGQLFQQEMWRLPPRERVDHCLPQTQWIIYPRADSMINNSGTQKRQNKISQPERGCEPSSSKTIQRAATTQTTNSYEQGLKDSGDNMNYKKAAEKKRLAGVLNHTHSDPTGEAKR